RTSGRCTCTKSPTPPPSCAWSERSCTLVVQRSKDAIRQKRSPQRDNRRRESSEENAGVAGRVPVSGEAATYAHRLSECTEARCSPRRCGVIRREGQPGHGCGSGGAASRTRVARAPPFDLLEKRPRYRSLRTHLRSERRRFRRCRRGRRAAAKLQFALAVLELRRAWAGSRRRLSSVRQRGLSRCRVLKASTPGYECCS